MWNLSSRHAPSHTGKSEMPSHSTGTRKGEELVQQRGREPGRSDSGDAYRTARDSTSIGPDSKGPIDPRMPHIPPA